MLMRAMLMRQVCVVVFLGCLSGAAFAQSTGDCACVTSPSLGGAGVGQVISASGEVLMSGQNGFGVIAPGQVIPSGAEIAVGCRAGAQIQVGQGCNLNLSQGSQAFVSLVNGQICVRTSQVDGNCTGGSGEGSAGAPSFGLPEMLFGGFALGAATAALLQGDTGAPPASP